MRPEGRMVSSLGAVFSLGSQVVGWNFVSNKAHICSNFEPDFLFE